MFLEMRCIRSHISFFRLGLTPTLMSEKIDAAQTTHNSVLCKKVTITLSEFNTLNSIKFIMNNIRFDIIIKINFSTV